MREFIVVGPINGFYHVAYRIIGTYSYSSIAEFSSKQAAYDELDRLTAEPDSEEEDK